MEVDIPQCAECGFRRSSPRHDHPTFCKGHPCPDPSEHHLFKPYQPDPIPNGNTPIADLVIADLRVRKAEGYQRYGTPLQARNGRDALRDLYEELLDAAQYARQMIEERRGR